MGLRCFFVVVVLFTGCSASTATGLYAASPAASDVPCKRESGIGIRPCQISADRFDSLGYYHPAAESPMVLDANGYVH